MLKVAINFLFLQAMSFVTALRIPQSHEPHNPPRPHFLDEMIKQDVIREGRKVCVRGTDVGGHSRNTWFTPSDTEHPPATYIPGTTFWWNEWQALGHAPYVISFLGVAHATRVDRVVMQRVVKEDLQKSWESWFSGFFQCVQEAAQSNFTVYLRYATDISHWHPHLQTNVDLTVSPTMCFEHIFQPPYQIGKKWSSTDIRKSFNPEIRNRFLTAVHQHTNAEAQPNGVMVSLRPNGREMSNAMELVAALNGSLKGEPVRFWSQSYDTSFAEQVKLVAESRVLIATHGAFETNLMWLDPGSLFIELRGQYMSEDDEAAQNFEAIADSFGVRLHVVKIQDLRSHRQQHYKLDNDEIGQIIQIANK
jgi:hypothetical protein